MDVVGAKTEVWGISTMNGECGEGSVLVSVSRSGSVLASTRGVSCSWSSRAGGQVQTGWCVAYMAIIMETSSFNPHVTRHHVCLQTSQVEGEEGRDRQAHELELLAPILSSTSKNIFTQNEEICFEKYLKRTILSLEISDALKFRTF